MAEFEDHFTGGEPDLNTESGARLAHIRVAVVGNFNPPDSGIRYQAEVLADSFQQEGASVTRITFQQNRWLRPFWVMAEALGSASRWDVVCVQAFSDWSFLNAAAAVIGARLRGKRVVVVYRGGAGPRFIARHPRAVPFILRKADLLVVPSGFLAAAFEPYGLEPRVIPNVIDVSEFRHRERAHFGPKLIWVRHLRPGYNPWMAIEVLNRVREHHPEATLVMVGGGAMLNELRIRIQREGITGVTLTGEVPQTELRRRLDEADIFLNTTTVDNQPRSVMEAIASGLPVVSTNVGGIPYLLKNEDTALLVQSHDAAGMSAAIERLVRDPGLGHALVSRGRQLILQHTWEAVVPRWARALTLPD